MTETRVGIVMGSDSDWPTMKAAAEACEEFDVAYEADVVSAHRMAAEMITYGEGAADRGLSVIIAGAGGAAHLPGMLAAVTPLPVIGVPVPLKYLDGMDSLLSIVQMPAGVPVATVAIGNARNAGLLAVRILAATDPDLRARMERFQAELADKAREKGMAVRGASSRTVGFERALPYARCPSRGHSMTGQVSITIRTPAAMVRSKAAWSTTPSWNQTPLAPTWTAWSANGPAASDRRNTSTTSTSNGTSASVA
jgi:5-(carboxyamino)imidazole ribonucleotide mutase